MKFTSLTELFLNLAQIDSPSGEEETFLRYVEKIFKFLGYYTEYDFFGNLILKSKECFSERKITPLLFSFHSDICSTKKPIIPVIKDEYITSDGQNSIGADNKSALACFLWVLINNDIDIPIEVVITTEEETGFVGARNLELYNLNAKGGYIFDGGMVGEIITSCLLWKKLVLYDIVNIDYYKNILESSKKKPQFIYDLRYKYFEDEKLLEIDLFAKKDENIINWINDFLVNKMGKNNFEYKIIKYTPPAIISNNEKIVKIAQKSIEDSGETPIITNWIIGNEFSVYTAKGIKMVNIGNGVENENENTERISIKNMETLCCIIKNILFNWKKLNI